MKKLLVALSLLVLALLLSVSAFAEDVTVDMSGNDVESASNQVTVHVALPEAAIGKRIDKVVLEVPIAVGESADSAFIQFPLVEIVQTASEEPKQTVLLTEGFDAIAHFDVTRFVRGWSNTDEHEFVLGALSESNQTVLALGTPGGWAGGVKARLIVKYSSLAGASATTIGNP